MQPTLPPPPPPPVPPQPSLLARCRLGHTSAAGTRSILQLSSRHATLPG